MQLEPVGYALPEAQRFGELAEEQRLGPDAVRRFALPIDVLDDPYLWLDGKNADGDPRHASAHVRHTDTTAGTVRSVPALTGRAATPGG
jgi:hypothetical protein